MSRRRRLVVGAVAATAGLLAAGGAGATDYSFPDGTKLTFPQGLEAGAESVVTGGDPSADCRYRDGEIRIVADRGDGVFTIRGPDRASPDMCLSVDGTLEILGDGSLRITMANSFTYLLPRIGGALPPGLRPGREDDLSLCRDEPATIRGTDGDDTIVGTARRDVISTGAGNDQVRGLSGDDLICLGSGKDHANGGPGDDTIYAGSGDDGSERPPRGLDGGPGNDEVFGEGGRDVFSDTRIRQVRRPFNQQRLLGGPGNDLVLGVGALHGQRGDDLLVISGRAPGIRQRIAIGGEGRDVLHGSLLADALAGGGGRDVLNARSGDDTLRGDAGNDDLFGGSGSDTVSGNEGRDRLFGDSFLRRLSPAIAFQGFRPRNRLINRRAAARLQGDLMFGGPGVDRLSGERGNDRLSGGDPGRSVDILNGGPGANDRQIAPARGLPERCALVEVRLNCR